MLAYASIWPRRFPLLCISPYDCSADSDSIGLYPKRSASVKPPVSKIIVSHLLLQFFTLTRGIHSLPRSRYMERYFSCSLFTTFFLREKESGGKKSAYKGDCAAIRCAPIRRSLPLIYPPMTAQPIARVFVCTRNGRQALSLPFLKEKYHVLCFSFSHLQSVYPRC